MKMTKKSLLVLLAVMVVAMFSMPANAFAVENPSANVQNGDIWRYGDVVGAPTVDADFDAALGASDVRLSQQVIADNGDGSFDVELKVQGGSDIDFASEQAIVLVIDRSGSMSSIISSTGLTRWATTINACVALVESYPENANVYFGIVTFDINANIAAYLNNNRSQVISVIKSLSVSTGTTNTADGLSKAKDVLDRYSGKGTKSAVVITDGETTSTTAALQSAANALKNSETIIYAVGIGGYNAAQLQSMASVLPNIQTVFGVTNIPDLNGIMSGFQKNVTVSMGPDIDLVTVISDSHCSYSPSSRILTWNLVNNTINKLVYQIQMKPSALDQGFKPVSSSAALSYTDTNGKARAENFDIPQVQWRSFFTVTFVDYDGNVLDEQIIPKGSDAVAPDDPDNYYGYHFVGWDKGFTNVTEDLTVTAEYEINTYSVTFVDWDGTELDAQTIEHGSAAVAPADPARTGYTFIGWDVDFDYITGELTVTAQYEINVYTVSFYKQSQDNSNKVAKTPFATQEVTYDELIDFTKVSVGKNAVWYFTDGTTFGAKFDLSTPVTGDLMLAVKDQNNNQQ